MRGTSLETIESQTQPDQLYQDLVNCTETHRERETPTVKQARAVLDSMACAVLMPSVTLSVLTEQDEDMTDMGHKATRKEKVMIRNQSKIL